jgi:hypothetical protein
VRQITLPHQTLDPFQRAAKAVRGDVVPTVCTKPIEFFKPDPSDPRQAFPEAELRSLGESLLKK